MRLLRSRIHPVVLAVFILALLAGGPRLASAQMEEITAIERQAQQLFQAGRYNEALAAAERLPALAAKYEAAHGQPGEFTYPVVVSVSWHALFARQPAKALEASERAHKLRPDALVAVTNRAHALLFLGRTDEARAVYTAHKGEHVPPQGRWEYVIAADFEAFRKAGLNHPQLAEMEKALAVAPMSAKGAQEAKESDELLALIVKVPQLHMAGDDAKALPLAERMLALSDKLQGPKSTITANNISTRADVLAGLGRHAEAEAAYKRSIAILEKNGTPFDLSFLPHKLFMLGQFYFNQGRYAEAEPLHKRVIAIKEKQTDPASQQTLAFNLDALGKVYFKLGLFAESEPLLKRALELMEKKNGPGSLEAGAVLNNLANLYLEQGRYADAEAIMLRALDAFERGGGFLTRMLGANQPLTAQMMANLAQIYQAQGRYTEAETYLKRALAIMEKSSDKPRLALALSNMALLYHTQGRFAEAEPLLKRALEIAEKLAGTDQPDPMLLNNLAVLYHSLGRLADAEALHKRALAIREAKLGAEHPSIALSLNNLAVIHGEQERYAEAEPLARRALAIREKALGLDHPGIALSLNNLAELLCHLHREAEAAPLYQRALEIAQKKLGPDHTDTAQYLHNLAGFHMTAGRYADSAQAYSRSLSVWQKTLGPDHPLVATSLNNTAELYFKQQDWARAASYWQQSTGILIQRFRRGAQNSAAARPGGGKTEAEMEPTRFSRLVRVSHRLSTAKPAEAPQIAARMFEAAQWAQNSAAAQSLALMAVRKTKGGGPLGALIREQQDLGAEWEVKDKLLAAARSNPPDKRDARVEEGLRLRLAAIGARLAEIGKALAEKFPDYAAFASPEPLSLAETQSYLKDNEALVMFLDLPEKAPLPEETFIWAVTKTASRWVRVPMGTPSLKREVQALRCGLDFDGAWGEGSACPGLLGVTITQEEYLAGRPLPFDANRAYALYRALFGEIEETIAGKRLLISASGPLAQLPFQVLVTAPPEAGRQDQPAMRQLQWLVRRHSLATLPAVSSLKALRRDARASHGTKPYFGAGNPLLDGPDNSYAGDAGQARAKQSCPKQPAPPARGGPKQQRNVTQVYMQGGYVNPADLRAQVPLPETADELCTVAGGQQAGAADVLLGAKASETAVKTLSEQNALSSYRVVHFATHGALAGQIAPGAEPGLLLTPPQTGTDQDDGYLSASEIVNLKFDADWVILSACNTAAGGKDNAEALSGLARSFFYAGARSMLVSHWPVYSNATVKLVTRALEVTAAEPAAGRAEAMRRAMLALIDTGTTEEAHPAFWAPFVVAGEGGR